jgi:hypothetical protein
VWLADAPKFYGAAGHALHSDDGMLYLWLL